MCQVARGSKDEVGQILIFFKNQVQSKDVVTCMENTWSHTVISAANVFCHHNRGTACGGAPSIDIQSTSETHRSNV